jgi:hypothetical protein
MSKVKDGALGFLGGSLGLLSGVVGIVVYLFMIGLFITLGLFVFHKVTSYIHHNTSTNNLPYVATLDNFQIKFPGNPNIVRNVSQVTNGIKGTDRVYDFQTNGDEYTVDATNLPGYNLNNVAAGKQQETLQADLNQSAQGYPATISNSKLTTFEGYPAITADLSQTQNGTTTRTTTLIFLDGSHIFLINAWGLSNQAFYGFANTFKNT